ncbi:DUF749 family protein [candidate division WOR-3 bacterium]|nr:DUF749 family protein [candidate division WOR-3 bacterium]
MNNNYIFTAELVAFMERQDLPPYLYPFIKTASRKEDNSIKRDSQLIVFKINGTIDSYYTIIAKNDISIEQIEDKIQEDLGVVELSNEAQDTTRRLLEKFHRGEFTFFLNHHVDREKYQCRR